MDIRIIIKIDELLKANRAGNSKEISVRLDISVRSVYNYITFMKSELNAPITYDAQNKNYAYERECELNFTG
ncbi:hypothetical protein [Flavobacterium sp.]